MAVHKTHILSVSNFLFLKLLLLQVALSLLLFKEKVTVMELMCR